jgi:PAS domain S-box-containing protein
VSDTGATVPESLTDAGSISDAAERRRIKALHALGILDSPFEERFDRLTRTAARLFDVPMAAVSLVDVNRQWFKACVGLEDRETSLETSLCTIAIRGGDQQLVIEDARSDPRFATHGAVTDDPWVRFYAGQPLRLPSGEIPGTLCVFDSRPRRFTEEDSAALRDLADLVERELTSEGVEDLLGQLIRVTARARAIADAAAEGIIALTPAGRVEFANDSAESMLGYGRGGLADLDLHAAVHGDGSECDGDCPLAGAIGGAGTLPSTRAEFTRVDRGRIPVEIAAQQVIEKEEVTGIVVTFADISSQVELERVREEFAAHVTHDLRSPLTTIRGFTEIVRHSDGIGEEERDQLGAVLRGTERLERLIDDLLALSELDAAPGEVERAPIDLAALVRKLADDLAAEAASRSLRVEVDAPDRLDVEGDADQLERAIANLTSNAIKYSPDDGLVTIRAAAADGRCTVSVSDRGPGVPPDEIEQLGDRFFRASTSGGVKGTGLGLAIAKEVADRHGGELRVESALGEGSTFTVELPVAAG